MEKLRHYIQEDGLRIQAPRDIIPVCKDDLLTGEIIPLVSDTHKNSDFISWLRKLDARYLEHDTIRLVLGNYSTHTSKETQKYLGTRPDRFEFVFMPKHGS